jgi:2-polyprenyl-3-methyl-5-hydroxy-6-metoxy-1,4-benzoquinol methylase
MSDQTRERQYQILLEQQKSKGLMSLGLMSSQVWRDDPKRLAFVLSRYKFVAKMFSGMGQVLEVGCADAFGTRIVQQEVQHVVATDFDPVFVRFVNEHSDPERPLLCKVHDMVQGPLDGGFDGVFALDVLEHISLQDEDRFLKNLKDSLAPQGVCILGTPSLESQPYASVPSKEGHVNCKTGAGLKRSLQGYFHNVFIFSMNDEVVHTGFYPMAHYLFAVCCFKRQFDV